MTGSIPDLRTDAAMHRVQMHMVADRLHQKLLGNLTLAARLRREMPLSLQQLTQRLRMGTWKSARTRVYYWRQPAVNASEETDVLML